MIKDISNAKDIIGKEIEKRKEEFIMREKELTYVCDSNVSDLEGIIVFNIIKKSKTEIEYDKEIKTDELYLYAMDGYVYKIYHFQDCNEEVYIESIKGRLGCLSGQRISEAKEISIKGDGVTLTIYTFRSIKGSVAIHWYGTSDGYYSEKPKIEKLKIYK